MAESSGHRSPTWVVTFGGVRPPQEIDPTQHEFTFGEEMESAKAASRGAGLQRVETPVVAQYGGCQGNEHEDWEPAKLADGSVIPHAICPDGYITPRMVQNGLRQIQKMVQAGQGTKAGGDGRIGRQVFEFLDGRLRHGFRFRMRPRISGEPSCLVTVPSIDAPFRSLFFVIPVRRPWNEPDPPNLIFQEYDCRNQDLFTSTREIGSLNVDFRDD